MTDPIEQLARAVLNDLDGAAALADLADENDPPTAPYMNGRPSPSRGTLLRKRIKRWQTERDFGNTLERAMSTVRFWPRVWGSPPPIPDGNLLFAAEELVRQNRRIADLSFRRYIRAKFIPKVMRA